MKRAFRIINVYLMGDVYNMEGVLWKKIDCCISLRGHPQYQRLHISRLLLVTPRHLYGQWFLPSSEWYASQPRYLLVRRVWPSYCLLSVDVVDHRSTSVIHLLSLATIMPSHRYCVFNERIADWFMMHTRAHTKHIRAHT